MKDTLLKKKKTMEINIRSHEKEKTGRDIVDMTWIQKMVHKRVPKNRRNGKVEVRMRKKTSDMICQRRQEICQR